MRDLLVHYICFTNTQTTGHASEPAHSGVQIPCCTAACAGQCPFATVTTVTATAVTVTDLTLILVACSRCVIAEADTCVLAHAVYCA
jgi:hypothetical protein